MSAMRNLEDFRLTSERWRDYREALTRRRRERAIQEFHEMTANMTEADEEHLFSLPY